MTKRCNRIFLPLFIFTVVSFGCSYSKPAPLEDGMHLRYKFKGMEESTFCDLTFTETRNGYFEVTVDVSEENIPSKYFIKPHEKDGKIIVNKFMKRRNGKPLEIETCGPLWLPPNKRKKGENVGIDLALSGAVTDKIENWNGWKVYIVEASAFRGAISGTWYYEVETGFLVGCHTKSVASEMLSFDDSPTMILVNSNVDGL